MFKVRNIWKFLIQATLSLGSPMGHSRLLFLLFVFRGPLHLVFALYIEVLSACGNPFGGGIMRDEGLFLGGKIRGGVEWGHAWFFHTRDEQAPVHYVTALLLCHTTLFLPYQSTPFLLLLPQHPIIQLCPF